MKQKDKILNKSEAKKMASMWTLSTNEFENLFPDPPEKQHVPNEDSAGVQDVLGDFNFFLQLEMAGMYGFESSRPRHHQQKRPYTGTENPDPKRVKTTSTETGIGSNNWKSSNHETRNGSNHDITSSSIRSSHETESDSNSTTGYRDEGKGFDLKTGNGSNHDTGNKSKINSGNSSNCSSRDSNSSTGSRDERNRFYRKTGNRESLSQDSPKNVEHLQNLAFKSSLILESLNQTGNSFVRGTGNGKSMTSSTPYTNNPQPRKNPGNSSRKQVSTSEQNKCQQELEQNPVLQCNKFPSDRSRRHKQESKQRQDLKIQ